MEKLFEQKHQESKEEGSTIKFTLNADKLDETAVQKIENDILKNGLNVTNEKIGDILILKAYYSDTDGKNKIIEVFKEIQANLPK